eukprot:TRINITY_DN5232_c0_g1_i1.p1 TRINITY_DN5232_c0_g1~~TRINITY_DN5232_c0_g1_i1.p1  ORF type:complete len:235 (+),score=64.61 TRINITY_DN5232_c0_g1_i1:68-772(+)
MCIRDSINAEYMGTPSNYNLINQRFDEQQQVAPQRARPNLARVPKQETLPSDVESVSTKQNTSSFRSHIPYASRPQIPKAQKPSPEPRSYSYGAPPPQEIPVRRESPPRSFQAARISPQGSLPKAVHLRQQYSYQAPLDPYKAPTGKSMSPPNGAKKKQKPRDHSNPPRNILEGTFESYNYVPFMPSEYVDTRGHRTNERIPTEDAEELATRPARMTDRLKDLEAIYLQKLRKK